MMNPLVPNPLSTAAADPTIDRSSRSASHPVCNTDSNADGDHGDAHAALVASGLVDEKQIAAAYSNHYLLPLFDPPDETFDSVDAVVAQLLPAAFCQRNRIVPLVDDGTTLQVAIDNPDALLLADDIRFRTGRQMRALFAAESVVSAGIERFYGETQNGVATSIDNRCHDNRSQDPSKPVVAAAVAAKGTDPLQWLLARVVQLRAESVHLQRTSNQYRLRFRIDGTLTEVSPPAAIESLVHAIEHSTAWDGNAPGGGAPRCESMRIRIHHCEIADGDAWTMQFHRQPVTPPSIRELAMHDCDRIDLLRGIAKPRGLTIVAGPCDSGKSETLYSALAEINDSSLSVFTVEQNVRYQLDGVNQTLVDDTDHFGLHDHLQSVLSQSPDVLLVHQIRDSATADLCVRVAEGGRRVLLTLPSADCISALRHLESMGISATRIGQTVRAVVAQRRMRKLCEDCKKPLVLRAEASQRLQIPAGTTIFQPGECARCLGNGYRGRVTAYEVMRLNSRMSRQLSRYGSMQDLEADDDETASLRNRMMQYVISGSTSLDEVRRAF